MTYFSFVYKLGGKEQRDRGYTVMFALEKKKRRWVFTWSVDDVGSQEFGPFLLIALLRNVTCKRREKMTPLTDWA